MEGDSFSETQDMDVKFEDHGGGYHLRLEVVKPVM